MTAALQLSARRIWWFAAAALPPAMLALPLAAYLPPFYARHGLSLALIGVIFMVARILDLLTDPLMGTLTDRTRSRWGARRPWLVAAMPVLLLGVWALFFPPAGAGALWLTATLLAVTLGVKILTIPHTAWSADIADNQRDRSRVQAAIQMVSIAGSIGSMLIPAMLEGHSEDPVGLRASVLGGLLLLLIVPSIGMALLSGHDSKLPPPPEPQPVTPLRAIAATLRRQPYLGKLLASNFIQGFAAGTISALSFYIALSKGVGARASLLILCYFTVGMCMIPVWSRLSYRVGKAPAIGWASLLAMLMLVGVVAAPRGDLPLVCLAFGGLGMTSGVWMFLTKAIVADYVAVEERAVRAPRAGLIFALLALLTKLGIALSVGMAFAVLAATGYVAGTPMTEAQGDTILALVVGVALIGHASMAWVAFSAPRVEQTLLHDGVRG